MEKATKQHSKFHSKFHLQCLKKSLKSIFKSYFSDVEIEELVLRLNNFIERKKNLYDNETCLFYVVPNSTQILEMTISEFLSYKKNVIREYAKSIRKSLDDKDRNLSDFANFLLRDTHEYYKTEVLQILNGIDVIMRNESIGIENLKHLLKSNYAFFDYSHFAMKYVKNVLLSSEKISQIKGSHLTNENKFIVDSECKKAIGFPLSTYPFLK